MTDRDIIRLRILLDRAASAMQNGGVVLSVDEIEELTLLLKMPGRHAKGSQMTNHKHHYGMIASICFILAIIAFIAFVLSFGGAPK